MFGVTSDAIVHLSMLAAVAATLGVLRVQSRRITQLEDARVADLRRHAALTVACEHAVQQLEKTAALILADCKTESGH